MADAWRAIDAARVMSSYDEFVHEPNNADEISAGTPLALAQVPTSEVLQYSNNLRSITGGRGRFELRHDHYDPVPSHLLDRLAKKQEPARAV